MVYTCGLYFALQSGYKHRCLCVNQLQLHEPRDKPSFIVYHETMSKTNSSGLAHSKLKPKHGEYFANSADLKKCFVRLYKKYQSLCPANSPADTFYLTPLRKPRPDCWYSTQPIGHNTLSTVVRRLCVMQLESLATGPIIPYVQLHLLDYSAKELMGN